MFSSSKFLQKLKSKDSFREVSDSDIFYQLTYMSAIASSGISRNRIFELGSRLLRPTAEYFRRVHLISQRMGYNYPDACEMVSEATESERMKSLLLRFSGALISGQPEADFLEEEALVQGDAYEKDYESKLESLKKWTDAYAAVVVSSALIIIINLTSTLIYDIGLGMIVGLIITAIFTASAGAWILSRAAPTEVRTIFSPEGPWTQRATCRLVKLVPPMVLIVSIILALLGVGWGWILILGGLLLFPLGIISMLAGREIDKKDKEIGPFLRSLGGIAISTGTTITEALTRVDLSSFPTLKPELNRLRLRLKAFIDPELCWKRFAIETGSKLIGETVTIFNDAVKLGGDPDTIAFLASQFAAKTIALRAKRRVIYSTFSWLTLVMHGAIASLMIIILEVIKKFISLLQTATLLERGEEAAQAMAMPIVGFGAPQLQFLSWVTVGMVVLLALINSFAVIATDGGHIFKVFFYLSILLFISGISLFIVPLLVEVIML
jgi:flagellar protein FlaJ